MTGSMQRAVDETQRRRTKQQAYNLEHGITPKGIVKSIADIMEGARAPGARPGSKRNVAEPKARYGLDIPEGKDLWLHIDTLEKEMYQAAKDLEFEKAATIRDKIHELKNRI